MLRQVLLDGAMGTALIAGGHAPDAIADLPVRDPDAVRSVHAGFATADAITSCTFALPFSDVDVESVAEAALTLAWEAAGERPVLGSLGPGERIATAARALAKADVLLLETFSSFATLESALDVVEHSRIWATMSFSAGRTTDGLTPAEVAARLVGRVEAAGANCGDGLDATTDAAIAMLHHGLPIIGRPSAGVGVTATPEAFAAAARRMWDAGVTSVGGCCGVGPSHITAAASALP